MQKEQLKKQEKELEWKRLEIHQLQNDVDVMKQEIKKLKNGYNELKEAKLKTDSTLALKTPQRASVKATGGNCEAYRPLISQYGWDINSAMLVMKYESGCNPSKDSSTNDHGLFQLHNQDVHDPAENVKIAYGKYVGGRVGANNWSAWYAVCTTGNNPQPKYDGIKCQ